MTWFNENYDASGKRTNGDVLLEQLKELNGNLEKLPQLIGAMNQLSLKIERHIKLGPR